MQRHLPHHFLAWDGLSTALTHFPQVATAPAGAQACAFDIKSFHRTCPVLPSHKPFLVAHFDGSFYLDHCHPFGAASASSNAGQVCNALVDIWQAEVGEDGRILKYEDDLPVIRLPNTLGPVSSGSFCYRFDRDTILALINPLRTPWHPVKTGLEFLDIIIYLGFYWDMVLRRVSLPDDKRLRYLAHIRRMIEDIRRSRTFSLLDVQELHGTLCHLCFVYDEGNSYLAVFSNAMAAFKGNTFSRRHLSKARTTLVWWESKLADASYYRQLRPLGPLRDFGIYVDASTSWGVAVVIGERWYALQLTPDWKSPGLDICSKWLLSNCSSCSWNSSNFVTSTSSYVLTIRARSVLT
jgi:hypothetical protein